jgi:hypothetical protein
MKRDEASSHAQLCHSFGSWWFAMMVPERGGGLEKIVIIADSVQLHSNRANENVKDRQTHDEWFVLYCCKR